MKYHEYWPCIIPECEQGNIRIEKYTVSREASLLTALGGYYSFVPPGNYTRLMVDGKIMMSDTPKERDDHLEFFMMARGHVLINGLGLGCATNVVLNKNGVEKLTMVEINKNVIDLVSPYFSEYIKTGKLEIIHADALKYKPPENIKYNIVWHDIWPSITRDNIPEMNELEKTYKGKCDWQASWERHGCEAHKNKH